MYMVYSARLPVRKQASDSPHSQAKQVTKRYLGTYGASGGNLGGRTVGDRRCQRRAGSPSPQVARPPAPPSLPRPRQEWPRASDLGKALAGRKAPQSQAGGRRLPPALSHRKPCPLSPF